jgi:hypothetical protein
MKVLLGGEVFMVLGLVIHQVCTIIVTNSLSAHYLTPSVISADVFQLSVYEFNGEAIEETKVNFQELSALGNEFGFESLLWKGRCHDFHEAHPPRRDIRSSGSPSE